jgi:hypothetical protein
MPEAVSAPPADRMDDGRSAARLRERPLTLLASAAGSPREMAQKVGRLAGALGAIARKSALDRRLERLRSLGYVETAPTRLQLVVGSIDMLRFWITPAADEYYRERGIDFGFHQVLRVLEEPASMVDPTGFLTERDVIIDHLLQVTHANPAYDLQLLESHEAGLTSLVEQVRQAIAGTHPKIASLRATVEDAGYHARLLTYAEDYLRDTTTPPPVRSNVAGSERWAKIEATFGTLPAAMRYFGRMPKTAVGAARHVMTVRTFPAHLGELA